MLRDSNTLRRTTRLPSRSLQECEDRACSVVAVSISKSPDVAVIYYNSRHKENAKAFRRKLRHTGVATASSFYIEEDYLSRTN
jgi:hypothetical protein